MPLCSSGLHIYIILIDSYNSFPGGFGAFAGAASVFGNTPIDVVKTRMQGLEASKYKSTMDCFVKIWKHEGPAA